jgi:hypothetical protein
MDSTSGTQGKEDAFAVALRLWNATMDGQIEWRWDPAARTLDGLTTEEYVADLDGTTYQVSGWGLKASGAIVAFWSCWSEDAVNDLFRLCQTRHDREAGRKQP